MSQLVFLDEAREEMLEAAEYYDCKAVGLGADFVGQVRRATHRITSFPDAGSLVDAETRRYMVNRFPFGILYRTEPEQIVVVAVMHLRRRPGYWRDRIPSPGPSFHE